MDIYNPTTKVLLLLCIHSCIGGTLWGHLMGLKQLYTVVGKTLLGRKYESTRNRSYTAARILMGLAADGCEWMSP